MGPADQPDTAVPADFASLATDAGTGTTQHEIPKIKHAWISCTDPIPRISSVPPADGSDPTLCTASVDSRTRATCSSMMIVRPTISIKSTARGLEVRGSTGLTRIHPDPSAGSKSDFDQQKQQQSLEWLDDWFAQSYNEENKRKIDAAIQDAQGCTVDEILERVNQTSRQLAEEMDWDEKKETWPLPDPVSSLKDVGGYAEFYPARLVEGDDK